MSIVRPVVRPVVEPIVSSIFRGDSGTSLASQVAALFAAGEVGGEPTPYDFSTMWQDIARTQPVTAPGQSVASALLKYSGGIYLEQVTMTRRPILRQDGTGRYYLEFDGVDDHMVFSSPINLNVGLVGVALESSAAIGKALLAIATGGYLKRGSSPVTTGSASSWLRNAGGTNNGTALEMKARQSLTARMDGTANGTEFYDSTGAGGPCVSQALGLSGNLLLGAFDTAGQIALQMNVYSAVFRAASSTQAQAELVRQYGAQRMGAVSP